MKGYGATLSRFLTPAMCSTLILQVSKSQSEELCKNRKHVALLIGQQLGSSHFAKTEMGVRFAASHEFDIFC